MESLPLPSPIPLFSFLVDSLGQGSLMALFSGVAALLLAALLARARRYVAGTTLLAPLIWAVAAAAFFAVVEGSLAFRGDDMTPFAQSALRYAASCGAFMPLMAVLGAKRPQDRGWQWVVAALWLTLLTPVAQLLIARVSGPLELPRFWSVVVGWLIVMGPLNYAPTRNALPALVVAFAQWRLYRSTMFDYPPADRSFDRLLPIALFALALIAARLLANCSHRVGGEANRRWLTFRDGWGAFWAVRVRQRLNQSAEASQLPARLEWTGWRAIADETLDDAAQQKIHHIMDSVLWRFEKPGTSALRRMPSAETR